MLERGEVAEKKDKDVITDMGKHLTQVINRCNIDINIS